MALSAIQSLYSHLEIPTRVSAETAAHMIPTHSSHLTTTVSIPGKDRVMVIAGEHRVTDEQPTHRFVDPSGAQPSWGGRGEFQLLDKGFKLKEFAVRIKFGSLTASASGGTMYRLLPADHIIERIEIWANNGSELVQTLTSEALRLMADLHLNETSRKVYNDRTVPPDASAFEAFVDVHSCLDVAGGLPQFALAADMRIVVFLRSLATSIETDHTALSNPACTINQVQIVLSLEDPHEKHEIIASHMTTPHSYHMVDWRVQKFALASGSSSASFHLSSVMGVGATIYAFIRLGGDTQTSLTAKRFLHLTSALATTDVAITTMTIRDSSGKIQCGTAALENAMTRRLFMPEWCSGADRCALQQIMAFTWATDPEAMYRKGDVTGTYHFDGSDQIEVTYPTLAEAAELYVICPIAQWLVVNRGQVKVVSTA